MTETSFSEPMVILTAELFSCTLVTVLNIKEYFKKNNNCNWERAALPQHFSQKQSRSTAFFKAFSSITDCFVKLLLPRSRIIFHSLTKHKMCCVVFSIHEVVVLSWGMHEQQQNSLFHAAHDIVWIHNSPFSMFGFNEEATEKQFYSELLPFTCSVNGS